MGSNKISSVNQVKENNTKLILNALKTVPSGTKSTVSQITGLSIATCNTILNELAIANRVLEVECDYPMSGRPPKSYKFNADYSHICCMYFTHEDQIRAINYAIVNLLGEVIEMDEVKKEFLDGQTIIGVIQELIEKDSLINKISTGFPGYLSDGKIMSSGTPELREFPLKQALIEHFGIEVHCDNDMNAIALGLFQDMFPQLEDPFTVIGLFKGRCPGAGSIVHKKIVKGMSNFAGEVLHIYATDEKVWTDISSHYDTAVQQTFLIVLSIITIINPRTIVLTGKNAAGDMIAELKKACAKRLLEEHIPEFIYIEDIKPYYIKGLFQKTV
ncbi:MAG: ROK family protein [Lachnospiraceae bacterium]